jgi:hypothetical protein
MRPSGTRENKQTNNNKVVIRLKSRASTMCSRLKSLLGPWMGPILTGNLLDKTKWIEYSSTALRQFPPKDQKKIQVLEQGQKNITSTRIGPNENHHNTKLKSSIVIVLIDLYIQI